jgi:hypothetical protein
MSAATATAAVGGPNDEHFAARFGVPLRATGGEVLIVHVATNLPGRVCGRIAAHEPADDSRIAPLIAST